MMKDTILALLLLLSACGGESLNPGTEEPLLVDKGTLHAGEVPPPPDTDPGTDSAATDLAVTDIELPSSVSGVGESRTLTGRVAEAAYAIAVQLASEATAAYGSGYWIVPIDGVDPQYPGERTWTFTATIGHQAPVGMARIRVAGIAGNGSLGPSRDVDLCLSPSYPDNLNACDPTLEPPALVLELQWDRDMDLDLEVVRPDGSVLSSKSVTAPAKGPAPKGQIDTDSLAGCKPDPRRTENAFWADKPPTGVYGLRVRLFSACSQTSVRFVARALLRQAGATPGTWQQTEVARWTGTLLASQVDGGDGAPLLLGNLEMP